MKCSKVAQTKHQKRYTRVASLKLWALCKKYSLIHTEKWYDHRTGTVMENENKDVKLLWDFNVQIDRRIEARRPDLILIIKLAHKCITRLSMHQYRVTPCFSFFRWGININMNINSENWRHKMCSSFSHTCEKGSINSQTEIWNFERHSSSFTLRQPWEWWYSSR